MSRGIVFKYIIFYISVILLFAGIYSGMSDHFYHSTIKYDAMLDKEAKELIPKLKEAITSNFRSYYNRDSIFLDAEKKWLFNIKDLEIESITYKDEAIIIEFTLFIIDVHEYKSYYMAYDTSFKLFLNKNALRSNDDVFRFGEIEENKSIYFGEKSLNFSSILYLKDHFLNKRLVGMKIPLETNTHLNNYINGLNGFPRYLDGNFFRMLYLSMVTITTLGYGDIVPLTNTARILIGFEATLGIIIMGLFVNSMMKGRK